MNPSAGKLSAAEKNEYYTTTSMGQVRCKLCDTLHRDEANFQVHLTGKRHTTNIKIIQHRKDQIAKEHDVKIAIAKQEAHDKQQESLATLSNGAIGTAAAGATAAAAAARAKAARGAQSNVGQPEVKMQVDPIGTSRVNSRVMFTVHYPLASTGTTTAGDGTVLPPSRPMHRWLNTFEQSVEPRDEGKQYLVFACEPYQSVAYAFPSNLSVATADNTDPRDIQRYFCRWDPVDKTYLLMFTVGFR